MGGRRGIIIELFTDKRMRLPAVATGANAEKIMRRNFVVVGPTVLSMTFDQVSENPLINVVLWHVLLNLSLLITLAPVLFSLQMAGGNPAKVQVAILNTCFRDLFSLHQFCPALGLAVLCLSLLVSANFRSLPL